MIKHSKQTKGPSYKFFTYDPAGRDTVITIEAPSEDAAWEKFDRTYGTNTIVDMVTKGDAVTYQQL